MNKTWLTWFFRGALFLLSCIFFYIAIRFQSISYPEFIIWIGDQLQQEELLRKAEETINEAGFSQLKWMMLVACVPVLLILALYIKFEQHLVAGVIQFLSRIRLSGKGLFRGIVELPPLQLWVFCILSLAFLAKAYWYVFHWPMQYDEAWTFNHFIHAPWAVTAFAPHNNHIFYTIIVKCFYHALPFLRPIEAIRLPLPLFSLLSGVLIFHFVKKHWSSNMALLAYAIFLSTGPIVFYALYARAYSLGILFNLLTLYALVEFVKERTKFYRVVFIVSAILSVYAIPSSIYFLVPLFGVVLIAHIQNLNLLKSIVLSGFLILVGVCLLYAPQIITTKLAWLTEGVGGSSGQENLYRKHAHELGNFLTGGGSKGIFRYLLMVAGGITTIFLASKATRKLLIVAAVGFVSPLLILAIQGQWIHTRVFSFVAIYSSIIVAMLLYKLLELAKLPKAIPIIALGWFIIFSYRAHKQSFFTWSNNWDQTTEEIFEILEQEEIMQVYNYFYYAKPALEYYSTEKNYPLQISMPQKASISFAAFDETRWEAVIWWIDYKGETPNLSNYRQVDTGNDEFEVYIRSDFN